MLSFYLSKAEPVPLRILSRDLLTSKRLDAFRGYASSDESFAPIRSQLLYQFGESNILDSLWEEWLFLQEQSWLVSRSRKTFRRFIKSGAVALETSKETFDALAARTLRLPRKDIPKALTSGQRLRASAKWIAVGGSSVALFTCSGSSWESCGELVFAHGSLKVPLQLANG